MALRTIIIGLCRCRDDNISGEARGTMDEKWTFVYKRMCSWEQAPVHLRLSHKPGYKNLH